MFQELGIPIGPENTSRSRHVGNNKASEKGRPAQIPASEAKTHGSILEKPESRNAPKPAQQTDSSLGNPKERKKKGKVSQIPASEPRVQDGISEKSDTCTAPEPVRTTMSASSRENPEQRKQQGQVPTIPGSEPRVEKGTPRINSTASKPTNQTAAAASSMDKSEERKDRIARLLAARASKPGTAGTTAEPAEPAEVKNSHQPGPPASEPSNISTSPKGQPKTEKALLLQQKLEALQKSREVPTENSNAPTSPPSPQVLGSDGLKTTASEPVSEPALEPASEPASESAAQPLEQDIVQPSNLPEMAPTADTQTSQEAAGSTNMIPGISLPSPKLAAKPMARKRPVAADFVGESDSPDPLLAKRRFLPRHGERPLIIDVSDDSDVEMDLASPGERPYLLAGAPKRTASFRDHPPLAGFGPLSRQPSSPGPLKSNIDLNNMTLQIEEMKRKIAEAESRKQTKSTALSSPEPTSDSQSVAPVSTPPETVARVAARAMSSAASPVNASMPAPLAADASSQTLPKPSVRQDSVFGGRRERSRVASEALPTVEASLRIKMSKLEVLRSQVAKLQKEVEDDTIRKQQLDDDLECSETESHAGPDDGTNGDAVNRPMEDAVAADTSRDVPTSYDNETASARDGDESGSDEGEVMEGVEENGASHSASKSADSTRSSPANVSEAPPQGPAPTPPAEEDGPDDIAAAVGALMEEVQLEGPEEAQPGSVISADPGSQPVDDTIMQETTSVSNNSDAQQTKEHAAREVQIYSEVRHSFCSDTRQVSGPTKTTFIPYDSPLRHFHAYRYHPDFKKTTQGGLRSMTYSNKIQANQALCMAELTEGQCTHRDSCGYQHFDSMGLAGTS